MTTVPVYQPEKYYIAHRAIPVHNLYFVDFSFSGQKHSEVTKINIETSANLSPPKLPESVESKTPDKPKPPDKSAPSGEASWDKKSHTNTDHVFFTDYLISIVSFLIFLNHTNTDAACVALN